MCVCDVEKLPFYAINWTNNKFFIDLTARFSCFPFCIVQLSVRGAASVANETEKKHRSVYYFHQSVWPTGATSYINHAHAATCHHRFYFCIGLPCLCVSETGTVRQFSAHRKRHSNNSILKLIWCHHFIKALDSCLLLVLRFMKHPWTWYFADWPQYSSFKVISWTILVRNQNNDTDK